MGKRLQGALAVIVALVIVFGVMHLAKGSTPLGDLYARQAARTLALTDVIRAKGCHILFVDSALLNSGQAAQLGVTYSKFLTKHPDHSIVDPQLGKVWAYVAQRRTSGGIRAFWAYLGCPSGVSP